MKSLSFKKIQDLVSSSISELSEFCFLVGSAATPRFRQDSDVDLAVYWKNRDISYENQLDLSQKLESLLGHQIDLISLNEIDVIYAIQVIETGRLLINNNPTLLLEWKVKQLSAYPDFKISRSIIEKNILNRKKYVRV
jgi:predicted nucleotidyltransferase